VAHIHNLSMLVVGLFLTRVQPSLGTADYSCLELPERRTAWSVVNCEQFQIVTQSKLVCLLSTQVYTGYSTLEVLHIIRYINQPTYLLT